MVDNIGLNYVDVLEAFGGSLEVGRLGRIAHYGIHGRVRSSRLDSMVNQRSVIPSSMLINVPIGGRTRDRCPWTLQ